MLNSDNLSRREFSKATIGSFLTYSMIETLCQCDAFADDVKPITTKWLASLNELGNDVKDQRLSQVAWQQKTEELFKRIDLAELLGLVDFERLTKNLKFVDNGARSLRFKFPEVEGLPKGYVFGKQVFALKKGRSVVPHGHNNMATAFLVLKGDLHGRHYDRLEDRQDKILIRPTIDRKFSPGECSSVSDYKDNIHWFKALTEPAFIFNIHVLNVRPGSARPTGRVYVDPNGKKVSGGFVLANRISYKQAHKMYG